MKNRGINKKVSTLLAMTVVTMVLFSLKACAKELENSDSIVMTTTQPYVLIGVAGADDIIIDWGDGKLSNINEVDLCDITHLFWFSHSYSVTITRNIVIYGSVTSLDCSGMGLTALDISRSTGMTYLRCYNNLLTRMDVSRNTTLKVLNCSSNQLTSLDVSRNVALTSLGCYDNPLAAFDVSNNPALEDLGFGGNHLTTLDLSRNTALIDLYVNNTPITNLDVTKNTAIRGMSVERNKLTSLDVSANTALKFLSVGDNQLTTSALNELFWSLPDNPNPETKN